MRIAKDAATRLNVPLIIAIGVFLLATPSQFGPGAASKVLVAHRGASAYAPEHTLEAYRLAIEQGADYVEQDLQISKDGVLICMHDLTLDRTTNAAEVFPDRHRSGPNGQRQWRVSDFSLSELKQLDAGSWFGEKFRGARIPTFQEAIDAVRGKAGLYPETKTPEVYDQSGLEMEPLVLNVLKKNGLDRPGADSKTPVIIQSFSAESLRKLRKLGIKLPLVFLINADPNGALLSAKGLEETKKFASGIGPTKRLIETDPNVVKRAHDLGLTVTPYTFRSAATGSYRTVREEMHKYLYDFGVDALFTDNPDQFPRTP
ncbi:MAG: glycerophosphodiester phosphodiesterase family protein [Acidobacteriota bacterium]